MSQQFKSYGNFVQTRAEASSLLECYAECRRCSSNFVQTSAESSSLLECYAECSRNSSKKTKASRKTQRLCMGIWGRQHLRCVPAHAWNKVVLLSMSDFVTTKYGDGR